jgi:hypothetical protein
MIKTKNDLIQYTNQCQNCYCAILDHNNLPKIQFVRYKIFFERILIMGINNSEMTFFDCAANKNIAVVLWERIEGYQLKGYQIPQDKEAEYRSEINIFKDYLQEISIDLATISLVVCYITDIYNVTPGLSAGMNINLF